MNKYYHILNLSLAGIILLIFTYSAIFSAEKDNHPVPSFYEKMSGERANSSGMSRAFSEIVRGNLDSARAYNQYSIPVFLFFFVQFFQRIGTSFAVKYWPKKLYGITMIDVTATIVLFAACFWGLIREMVRILTFH